jgi:hypothetical protein
VSKERPLASDDSTPSDDDTCRLTKNPVTVTLLLMTMLGLEVTPTFWHHPPVSNTQVPLSYIFFKFVSYYLRCIEKDEGR